MVSELLENEASLRCKINIYFKNKTLVFLDESRTTGAMSYN